MASLRGAARGSCLYICGQRINFSICKTITLCYISLNFLNGLDTYMETVNMKNIFKTIIVSAICAAASTGRSLAESVTESPDKLLPKLVAAKWGVDNVVLPSSKILVQYEQDLGERWIVNFETGDVALECLWNPDTPLDAPQVINNMICAISNLYVSVPVLPQLMLEQQQRAGYIPATAANQNELKYEVRKGDTLSEISETLRVPIEDIMLINGITNPHKIKIGEILIIPAAPPHMHLNGETHTYAAESLLHGQLVNPENGEIITPNNIGAFSEQLIRSNGIQREVIEGGNGKKHALTRVKLSLAEDHLQTRARRYYPMVCEHAQRFGHDPALIMALIHTESAFNPQAASGANAYGLMQVVPAAGGREAYRWLHSKDIKPSPAYLLKPSQNLELGNAYMMILKEHTFSGVKNLESRLYCAVAAYNGGGVNVGRAFTGRKSVQASLRSINAKSPAEVRRRLEKNAPYKETREYVKQVLDRVALYSEPQWR